MTTQEFNQSVTDEIRRRLREAEQLEDSRREALWPSIEEQEQYWRDHPEPPRPEEHE